MYGSQVTMLYTWNLHSAVCQLCLDKIETKHVELKNVKENEVLKFIKLDSFNT